MTARDRTQKICEWILTDPNDEDGIEEYLVLQLNAHAADVSAAKDAEIAQLRGERDRLLRLSRYVRHMPGCGAIYDDANNFLRCSCGLIQVQAATTPPAREEEPPILGHCPKCGTPFYSEEGFCGRCKPGGPV